MPRNKGKESPTEGTLPTQKTLLRKYRGGTTEAISVVGIGASAGGLETLTSFLANVPAESTMAFVLVQHLDPTHKGMMVDLLQRHTTMQIAEAVDRTRVKPAHVYVIPPNKDLSFRQGLLHLHAPVAPHGLHLPIDFFFRSLAADLQRLSIGVILSGMGSDGTLGLRAIKERDGVAFVQNPDSAKFDAMPRSAIEAGLADIVAPVEEIPSKIFDYLRYLPVVSQPGLAILDQSQSSLEKVVALLRSQTGHDFSQFKKTTMYHRIERRMSLNQIETIAAYVGYLRTNSQEIQLLSRELMIGVT